MAILRRVSVFLMIFGLTITLKAGVFRHVDWNCLITDSILPLVDETIDLGKDWQRLNYTARIDYPEYEPLAGKELSVIKKLECNIPDTLKYKWTIGVSRKKGLGQLSILPIVREGKKYKKLVSYKLTLIANHQTSSYVLKNQLLSEASKYAAHSVLQSGKWIKIKVQNEGIYQITSELVKKMGFSSLDKIKVYGYGGRVQSGKIDYNEDDIDDLQEVPTFKRGKNNILFYANGVTRWSKWTYSSKFKRYLSERQINPYSSYSYYFVTEGDDVLRIQKDSSEIRLTESDVLTTYPEHELYEKDEFAWLTSGRHLYDSHNFSSGKSLAYTLSTPQADTTKKAVLTVTMTAASTSQTTSLNLTFNGISDKSIISKCGQHDFAMSTTRQISTKPNPGDNKLFIQTSAGNDARLDYFTLCYDNQLYLSGKELQFSHYKEGGHTMQLSGANEETRIWCIGEGTRHTFEVPFSLSDGILTFKVEDPTRRYVAFDASREFSVPEIVGKVVNQDLHADSLVNMVIIIPASGKLQNQAERLAQAHRQNGMKVSVVKADKIYNEFSSGTPDAGAYRRYLKMLYDRDVSDTPQLQYLLLFGNGLWDNRMLSSETNNVKAEDYLLCYESENSLNEVNSYVTDDFFGLLDDGEGDDVLTEKIDLGIGRFPVTTEDEAKILVDKTINYMANGTVGSWKNAIYMLADDADNNSHMKDAEVVAKMIEEKYPSLLLKRIYWDAYQRVSTATGNTYPAVTTELKDIMKKGALVMNYSGHGAPYTISHELVLKINDFKEFASAKIPMWVIASCELTPFDMPVENIGQQSMLNKNGAAIAFYSASRAVYSDLNRILNKYYMQFLLGKDSEGRRYTIGDAARLTKINLVDETAGDTDFSNNKLKYSLMGDPALTLSMPTENVVIDEINGIKLTSDDGIQLKAGSIAKIKGHIESSQKVSLSDFNGMLCVTLQDSKDTITCHNNAKDDVSPFVYYEHTKILNQGSDSILNGEFEISIPIPLDINYTNQSGKLSLYASNRTHTIEANGMEHRFLLGSSEQQYEVDSIGPSIYLYLNDPEFQDGGNVNETPYFYAVLSDSDGINTTGNGLGHDLLLIVDGEEQYTYTLNNYYENDFGSYTRGTICFQIPTLTEGDHRLFFRAWDLKNNSSSRILHFHIVNGMKPSLTDVNLSQNPASTQTTFLITYDRPECETKFTIEVYNCWGILCWKHEETASTAGYHTIQWNLTSNSGQPLPSGLYVYKVGITCAGSAEVTKSQKIIIHKQ